MTKAEIQMVVNAKLDKVFFTLKPRDEIILRLHYGTDGGRTFSLTELAEILKITYRRVCQIKYKAIRKLQHPSRSRHLENLDADSM